MVAAAGRAGVFVLLTAKVFAACANCFNQEITKETEVLRSVGVTNSVAVHGMNRAVGFETRSRGVRGDFEIYTPHVKK